MDVAQDWWQSDEPKRAAKQKAWDVECEITAYYHCADGEEKSSKGKSQKKIEAGVVYTWVWVTTVLELKACWRRTCEKGCCIG